MAVVIRTFAKSVTTAGTRVQVSTSQLLVTAFAVRSLDTNTGKIYIGDSSVSASNGMFLLPGEVNEKVGHTVTRGQIRQFDLAKVYLDSAVNGESVRVEYIVEE